MTKLARFLPRSVKTKAKRALYWGRRRYCALCGSRTRRFLPAGTPERPDARCPVCQSLERHRLVWEFLRARTSLFAPQPLRLLHIAPEPQVERNFRRLSHVDYVTADLIDPRAMLRMDICDIDLPDASFGAVYCSHVLEHVDDDRRAMREIRRILEPGGWAILNVPITAEKTYEDPSITDPEERQRLFGQWDHVRVYGPDYVDRLVDSGFRVEVVGAADLIDRAHLSRLAIPEREQVFFCERS